MNDFARFTLLKLYIGHRYWKRLKQTVNGTTCLDKQSLRKCSDFKF